MHVLYYDGKSLRSFHILVSDVGRIFSLALNLARNAIRSDSRMIAARLELTLSGSI